MNLQDTVISRNYFSYKSAKTDTSIINKKFWKSKQTKCFIKDLKNLAINSLLTYTYLLFLLVIVTICPTIHEPDISCITITQFFVMLLSK